MNSKRFWLAIKETIFIIALIHIILLVIYAVLSGNFVYLNVANILDIQLFFRQLEYTPLVGLIGWIFVVALFVWNYFRLQKRR